MSTVEAKYKIAVLIDFDNFNNEEYLKLLFDELNDYGDVIIKEAYFSDINSTISPEEKNVKTRKKFIEKLQSLGISPKIQIPYTTKKNATDIRIAIEAMDLLNKDYVTCFCLASCDSDLTPLATRLKKENRFVIGAGVEKTPKPFKDECNFFINIDTRIKDSKNTAQKQEEKLKNKPSDKMDDSSKKKILDLVAIVNKLIEENKDEKGFAQFSQVIETLKKRQTDFSPKNYGHTNKNTLPFFQSVLNEYFTIETRGNTAFISIKQ